MTGNPELTALFDQAMATFAPWTAPAVAAAIDFSAFGRVVDVGGGNKGAAIGILKACPGLAGVVFDQPHAAAQAREQVAPPRSWRAAVKLSPAAFSTRCRVGRTPTLVCHVLVDWDDERAAAIPSELLCRNAPAGQVLILEEVYPAQPSNCPTSAETSRPSICSCWSAQGDASAAGEVSGLARGVRVPDVQSGADGRGTVGDPGREPRLSEFPKALLYLGLVHGGWRNGVRRSRPRLAEPHDLGTGLLAARLPLQLADGLVARVLDGRRNRLRLLQPGAADNDREAPSRFGGQHAEDRPGQL